MKDFAELYLNIDSTTSTNRKIDYLSAYFEKAGQRDKLWVMALFSHKRPRRTVQTRLLREWAAEYADIPLWLFEETYHIVGDLAETIAKLIPPTEHKLDKPLHKWIEELSELKDKADEEKKRYILEAWKSQDSTERFLFNKIITGGFRVGVSQKTIVKALSNYLKEDPARVAHKLMGDWTPNNTSFEELLIHAEPGDIISKPFPFYLAYPLEGEPEDLGPVENWTAEYKWDGIRAQLIKRKGELFLWSRGEELITHQFPEFTSLLSQEGDFVVDGELIVCKDYAIRNFQDLQKRLGRKKPGKKILEEHPAALIVYDVMELNGNDLRNQAQSERREILKNWHRSLDSNMPIRMSHDLKFKSWDDVKELRAGARDKKAEGLMLKSKPGPYKTGRKKGDWYKWKIDPLTIDAVMIYAQRGHGRRANLFTDFTFALKDGDTLVPFAKAYSGLTDSEFREISSFVRANTIERFGPVCSVPPVQVFEVAFENVGLSKRHKSGVAVRFPRILRWRKDKKPVDINSLDDLKALIR